MIGISLCMIVKNEETTLESCLSSVTGVIDEIIIVDTGSTDRTKEIALRYTDKVFDYTWNNSFADARNFSISKASNDFVLIMDSDEIVVESNLNEIKKLIKQNPKKIGRIIINNEYIRAGEGYKYQERVNRLFSKKYFKYEGNIHEQVIARDGLDDETYNIPLTLVHSGYEGDLETRQKKTKRNIELLNIALKDKPSDPYILYQLGKSYYMEEDYVSACSYFEQALSHEFDIGLEYVHDMVESYGYALLNSNQYENAMGLLGVYDEFATSADFVFLIGLIYMNNAKFTEAIGEFIKATRMQFSKMDGVSSYRAYYNIGVIYECLGQVDKAKEYYKKCGDYGLAAERLRQRLL